MFSKSSFPFYRQHDIMDCGPTCLRMISKHYGRAFSIERLRERSNIGKLGVSLGGIAEAAESVGFRTIGVKTNFEKLAEEAPLPLIAHWNQSHFVVVYKITPHPNPPLLGGLLRSPLSRRWQNDSLSSGEGRGGANGATVFVADPSHGLLLLYAGGVSESLAARWRAGFGFALRACPSVL